MGTFTFDKESFDLAMRTGAGRIASNLDGEPAPEERGKDAATEHGGPVDQPARALRVNLKLSPLSAIGRMTGETEGLGVPAGSTPEGPAWGLWLALAGLAVGLWAVFRH